MDARFQKIIDNWRFEREAEAREVAWREAEHRLLCNITTSGCACEGNGNLDWVCRAAKCCQEF